MADQSTGRPGGERTISGQEASGDVPGILAPGPRVPGPPAEMPRGSPIGMRVEIRRRGACPLGLSVGDLFRSDRQVGAVCHWAGDTGLPWTTALRLGGDVPWKAEPGLERVCCPDLDKVAVLEVRRRSVQRPMPPGG